MSFLNPVNKPVLRFSSTDTGAPQINYGSRVPGDVKAVLKACLVGGYGAKSSAGWSIVNEVNHVAEFVSPSAAMSDYRLGIDDTITSSTTWYYQYQDVRTNPINNKPARAMDRVDFASPDNGWQLLVTDFGLFFIEIVKSQVANNRVARLTYWGRVKSAMTVNTSENIAFYSVGADAPNPVTAQFFQNKTADRHHAVLNGLSSGWSFTGANVANLDKSVVRGSCAITTTSDLYLSQGGFVAAKYAGILINDVALDSELLGVYDSTFASRDMLKVCIAYKEVSMNFILRYSVSAYIALDYWEY